MPDQKRSSTNGMETPQAHTPAHGQGVGGRHTGTPRPTEGGGYLDIYTKSRAPDPRLAELLEMGLSKQWLRVAERIGVDAFLATWQILDEFNNDGYQNKRRLRVPLYSRYWRYQRNKVVYALSDAGLSIDEIKARARSDLGEELSKSHISILIKRRKNKNKRH